MKISKLVRLKELSHEKFHVETNPKKWEPFISGTKVLAVSGDSVKLVNPIGGMAKWYQFENFEFLPNIKPVHLKPIKQPNTGKKNEAEAKKKAEANIKRKAAAEAEAKKKAEAVAKRKATIEAKKQASE